MSTSLCYRIAVDILKFEDSVYVLGNQAADLDSTVSAFSLAALLEALNPGLKAIPLIQGSKDDLRLKPEIEALFERITLDPGNESFLDRDSRLPSSSKVILVDHNKPDYPGLESVTAGIVDHHKDEGFLPELPLRIIRKTGSCATLIAELWRDTGIPVPPSQCILLLAALTVDTGNLDPEWGKTTAEDKKIYDFLSRELSDDDRYFILSLPKIKLDLSHLNQQDQLRRDYKELNLPDISAGISSVPMSVDDFFAPSFFDSRAVESFMKDKGLDLLIIMHSISDPFRRQLSFCSRTKEGESENRLSTATGRSMTEALDTLGGFDPLPSPAEGWHSYDQEDPTVSRKRLSPRLQEILIQKLTGNPNQVGPETRGKI